jgi:ABC-type polar amino acid transport system ATPase subunit
MQLVIIRAIGNSRFSGAFRSAWKGAVSPLIGRSGSGKSTLLRCINGLEAIDSGEIRVGDVELTRSEETLQALRQNAGIVFQSFDFFRTSGFLIVDT